MFNPDNFFSAFPEQYYADLVLFTVELIVLIIALKYGRKTKPGRIFIVYILFDFILLVTDSLLKGVPHISKKNYLFFLEYTNTIIGAVELLVYYYFFYTLFESKKIRKLIIAGFCLYSLLMIIYLTTRFNFSVKGFAYSSSLLGATEFIFILPYCLLFFYRILNIPSSLSLQQRPSFWIMSGIFFYSFLSIPFYLLIPYLQNEKSELTNIVSTILFYFPFIINFIFLAKAFLCKKPLTI